MSGVKNAYVDFPHHGRSMVFDERQDISTVAQFGAVDLRVLAENNAIPGDVGASATDFDGVDDPGAILGRPSDPFEEIAMRKAVNEYKAPKREPTE